MKHTRKYINFNLLSLEMSQIPETGMERKPQPAVLCKVLELENQIDSGLADSREFTPEGKSDIKIVKFSPLVRTKEFDVANPKDDSSEEINLSLISDNDNAPMQSSGVTDYRMNDPDISTIDKGDQS